ncbi:phosphatase PAP2 family protein [Spiroplasma turonicum]|uniref:Phosphatidic acid phosphatase type 2/haloperoxidase domain-containing protein n=1 Tax=Spiroplasma turonicum TaxID=216946 RepID=A0A0K1P773_9MOLU|nr:phosphatase PAP2 family protein [Spiroplasma turonicum]AKU80171.1 hypothetical protein STURON_00925 [Spiroplasma turonicum]ALX71171.1 hypothetical protein STURO_v1c09200 [Spiroplasma turonicum]
MAIKLDKKLKKRLLFWMIIILISLLSIPLIIFDLKISKSIPATWSKSWFSLIFDQIGIGIIFIPIYFLLLIFVLTINYSLIKTKKNKQIIYWLFNIIYLLINVLFFYYNDSFNFKKDSKESLYKLVGSLVCILVSFIFYFSLNMYIYKKKLYKDVYWLSNISSKTGYAFFVIFFSQITVQLLKVIFGRLRPDEVINSNKDFYYAFEPNFSSSRGNSFPSGHTLSASLLFVFLFFFYLPNKKTQVLKIITILTASIVTLLVGISRITMLDHFASDVYFSIVILFIYMYYSKSVVNWFRKKIRPRNL